MSGEKWGKGYHHFLSGKEKRDDCLCEREKNEEEEVVKRLETRNKKNTWRREKVQELTLD